MVDGATPLLKLYAMVLTIIVGTIALSTPRGGSSAREAGVDVQGAQLGPITVFSAHLAGEHTRGSVLTVAAPDAHALVTLRVDSAGTPHVEIAARPRGGNQR